MEHHLAFECPAINDSVKYAFLESVNQSNRRIQPSNQTGLEDFIEMLANLSKCPICPICVQYLDPNVQLVFGIGHGVTKPHWHIGQSNLDPNVQLVFGIGLSNMPTLSSMKILIRKIIQFL
ncbi:6972_t:CDS:2 [Entrophospora sp. SA101]|nr:6972_t:CDS:2 [Entrophospora sp. SA101]